MKRFLLVLVVALLPLSALAQPKNEIGLFVSTSQFSDSEIRNGVDTIDVGFDEDMGYGVSYNRFWTNGFSTELAYQKLGADLTLSFQDITTQAESLDLDMLSATAQYHFARGSMLSPYLGAGAVYVSGQSGAIDQAELGKVDLESDVNWLANAGLDIGLGHGLAIFVDGKYVMYEARGKGEPDGTAIDINPLIVAAGLKLRF